MSKALALSGLVCSIPTFITAQQLAPGVKAGDAVRFTIREEGSDRGASARYRCEGTVSGFSFDALLVAADQNCATTGFAPTPSPRILFRVSPVNRYRPVP